MTSKGGAAHVIVCHFCPYACTNDDYTYHHLVATHLNIQWGCGICFEYVSKIREHVLSHQKKSSREQSQSSHKKDEDEVLGSPLDSVSSDEEVSDGDSPGREDDHD